jgi:hypothetical protein
MRRLAAVFVLLGASVLLYVALFALVLDRPLSLGTLRHALGEKLASASAEDPPRLIILAGSNALFSHSCAVIGAMLRLPCVNGGVALGLGLDYQFALWKPVLKRGDTLYMPMELQQYTVDAGVARMGPDAALMLRQDRVLLLSLGLARTVSALFSGTLPDAVAAVVESLALALHPGLANPAFGEMNAEGDGIGHSLAKAAGNRAFLASLHRPDPSIAAIRDGYGAREISRFLDWAARHGVTVIGGFPTEFADAPQDASLGATLAHLYVGHSARFLALAGGCRYPRRDFFDAQDHLVTECQMKHSILLASALAPLLGRAAGPPPAAARLLAARCP